MIKQHPFVSLLIAASAVGSVTVAAITWHHVHAAWRRIKAEA